MRRNISFVAAVCLFALASALLLRAQTTTQAAPNFKSPTQRETRYLETVPALVPSSTTTVWDADIWLEEITLTNTSGSTVTVTIQDRQATPVPIVVTTIAAGANYAIEFQARYAPSGVTWSASSGTAIAGYMRGKR